MGKESDDLNLTFTHRGNSISLVTKRSSTLGELGEKLQLLTGVAPHTMKVLVPQGHRAALQPFTEEHAVLTVQQCGLEEGKTFWMMGALPEEVIEVSEPPVKDRIVGFAEEDKRARQRVTPVSGSIQLSQGQYGFGGFRTLQLPGVQMTPAPSKALELMHTLASDRGIVAIMNKHRWRVGIMTEMAPEGLVGISPKCLLGLNKNHGEEISLRLRTDDLKGFRKYESIKKTILHELAHMVYGEHDDNFYRLDRQLNKEAAQLDWTRSKGHSLNGMKHKVEMAIDEEAPVLSKGYRLGGGSASDARGAAATAAFKRSNAKAEPDPDDRETLLVDDSLREETHPRGDENVRQGFSEPDPDDLLARTSRKLEPDPDDKVEAEPDPDDKVETKLNQPDKDDKLKLEPDPDDKQDHEPDPDDKLDAEPDPDDKMDSEPDPDDKLDLKPDKMEFEPDPDDKESKATDTSEVEDPNASLAVIEKGQDPGLARIHDAAAAATKRLQQSIAKLRLQASPSEACIALHTLSTILRNIMEHPDDQKYRCLRKTNPVFQQRVARFEGALELLRTVGFSEEVDVGAAKDCLVLKHDDPGLLWLARSSLETLA